MFNKNNNLSPLERGETLPDKHTRIARTFILYLIASIGIERLFLSSIINTMLNDWAKL